MCAVTMIAFWTGVLAMMVRRPLTPTRGDLAFIRWNFVPLFLAAAVVAELMGR
jgi:hypothetical protein